MREGINIKQHVAITETLPSRIALDHGAASKGRTAETSAARQQTGPAVGGWLLVAHSGEVGRSLSKDQCMPSFRRVSLGNIIHTHPCKSPFFKSGQRVWGPQDVHNPITHLIAQPTHRSSACNNMDLF